MVAVASVALAREDNMAGQVGLIGMLAIATSQDIKKKQIRLIWVIIFALLAILIHILTGEDSIFNMLLGIIPGVALIGLSFVFRGRIGLGDGCLLVASGLFLGLRGNMDLFLTALLFCGIWAMGLVVIRKKKGDYEIPFAPFLLAAYIKMLVFQEF